MRGKIKEFLFIKLTLYVSLSIRIINKANCIMYEKLAKVFSVAGFHFEDKLKPMYLVIYSRFLDLTSHSHGEFATWG